MGKGGKKKWMGPVAAPPSVGERAVCLCQVQNTCYGAAGE